jgi:hypothetical protein
VQSSRWPTEAAQSLPRSQRQTKWTTVFSSMNLV